MGRVIGALKKLPEAGMLDFGDISKRVQASCPETQPRVALRAAVTKFRLGGPGAGSHVGGRA